MPRQLFDRGDSAARLQYEQLVFRTAELFLDPEKPRTVSEVQSALRKEGLRIPNQKRDVSRQQIYPLLQEARSHGFLQLVPPVPTELEQSLYRSFPHIPEQEKALHVVGGEFSPTAITSKVADRAIELLREIGAKRRKNDPVILGLGPGRATLGVCQVLAPRLTADSNVGKVGLFAIASTCLAKEPQYASVSFFNLFHQDSVTERLGLFAPTVVKADQIDETFRLAGACEVGARKNDVDIVITAMGDFEDKHDTLRAILNSEVKPNWLGNVQYRPYTAEGPVEEKGNQLRAVTLFELDDFVTMAKQKDHHVLLIARQCGECKLDRAKALLPLLENPRLKVWSEIFMDIATGKSLLKLRPPPAASQG